MDTRSSVWLMKGPLAFDAPGGKTIEATGERLELFFEDNAVATCDVTFRIAAEAYAAVDAGGFFQLAPEMRGPGSATFKPTGMVTIEARLANQFLTQMLANGEEAEAAAELLQKASAGSPLRSVDSWFALHVTEDVELPEGLEGSLRSGYRTTWDDDEDESGDNDNTLLAAVMDYFEREGVQFAAIPDTSAVAVRIDGNNLSWDAYVVTKEQRRAVSFYSVAPQVVPPRRRAAAAEYIARANWGMPLGNLEMDYSDGEVRFKTSIVLADQPLTDELFGVLAEFNVVESDTYMPGLLAVIEGAEPRGAARDAEERLPELG